MTMKRYKDKDWLYGKYWDEGLSTYEIAKLCTVRDETIRCWLKSFSIKRRARSEALKLRHIKNPDAIKGENNPRWKGGKTKDGNGYILIHKPDHPHANNSYVLEHRLIAEKALGRYLKSDEAVHHINEIKDDNRNCNLLICTFAYHMWLHKKIEGLRKYLMNIKCKKLLTKTVYYAILGVR